MVDGGKQMEINKYLRTPIKIEQLIQITPSELDEFTLYADKVIETVDENTVFYLDEPIEVDENDNELYPSFINENNLRYFFNGDIVSDIISNAQHQLEPKTPTIDDYVKNFDYYHKHDCFFNFE